MILGHEGIINYSISNVFNFNIFLLERGNRDSSDQLNWTTVLCKREAEGEYIVGISEMSYTSL